MRQKALVIDGQLLQTSAWYRGMGKYTIQFLRQLSEQGHPTLRLILIFNKSLPVSEERQKVLSVMCPNIEQRVLKLPLPRYRDSTKNTYKQALKRNLKDITSAYETYHLLTSLFSFDFFAEFMPVDHKILIFYDLIPLFFWKDLGGYFPPHLYMSRFDTIYESGSILAISATTKDDVINTFGIAETKITNINGGYTKISSGAHKPKDINTKNPYVLFPSGDLPHKNNETIVRGWELYCEKYGDMPLLITSSFNEVSKRKLEALSNNIIFTENVSDEELEWLFLNAQAILFGSRYEGLGMPVLDAVAFNKPIITSRISVFMEMSAEGFYYFDPDDIYELSESIRSALKKKNFIKRQRTYKEILLKYTWEKTGAVAVEALMSEPKRAASKGPKVKQSIALVCLHPGIPDQIGRLAEKLYCHLKDKFDVNYFFDSNGHSFWEMERPTFLDLLENCKVADISKLDTVSYKRYDKIVYLLDSKAFPSRVAQRSVVIDGLVVVDRLEKYKKDILQSIVMKTKTKIKYDKTLDIADIADFIYKVNIKPILVPKTQKYLLSKRVKL